MLRIVRRIAIGLVLCSPLLGQTVFNPGSGGGGGSGVTNVATTSPLGGGPIMTTGTLTCTTCGVTGSPLSQFTATTSAQFFGVISDETGTGVVVGSASPTLTGTPAAPTATVGTNTTQIATTAFVLANATGSGTVNPGTQFQMAFYPNSAAAVSGDSNVTTDSGGDLSIAGAFTSGGSSSVAGGAKPFWGGTESSNTFTPAANVDGEQINSTNHCILESDNASTPECHAMVHGTLTATHAVIVNAQLGSGGAYDLADAGSAPGLTSNPLSQFAATTSAQFFGVISDETGTGVVVGSASPTLTGTPAAPTATVGTNTTQIATTAFVLANAGSGSTVKQFLTTTFSQTFSVSFSAANMVGLSFTLAASTSYELDCSFNYTASAGTTDINYALTGPASPTLVTVMGYGTGASTSTLATYAAQQAGSFPTQFGETSTLTAAGTLWSKFTAIIVNGANSGTLQVQAGAEGAGTLTVNAKAGSCVLN